MRKNYLFNPLSLSAINISYLNLHILVLILKFCVGEMRTALLVLQW